MKIEPQMGLISFLNRYRFKFSSEDFLFWSWYDDKGEPLTIAQWQHYKNKPDNYFIAAYVQVCEYEKNLSAFLLRFFVIDVTREYLLEAIEKIPKCVRPDLEYKEVEFSDYGVFCLKEKSNA